MTTDKEIRDLIRTARRHGAIIRTRHSGGDGLGGGDTISEVMIRSGVDGVGSAWIGLIRAAEILRRFNSHNETPKTSVLNAFGTRPREASARQPNSWFGQRVYIYNIDHPHYGKSGEVTGEFKTVLGQGMLEVTLDDTLRVGAIPSELRLDARRKE